MTSEQATHAAITFAIITMAKSLKLKVIAEGVESEQQLSLLREHRCDEIQGNYFSTPLVAGELTAKLLSTLPGVRRFSDN
jgi:EAL domain-containing protein (putative c-di-GMP-specific phosphodiesterase class I)